MNDIRSIEPESLETPILHSYLLSAVAPRPIAFASTVDQKGNVNLSPFSFFNVFSSNPPIMIFSPSRRGRDNTTKHTYENIKEVAQTVISIVNYPMVEQMSLASTEYDKGVNEFIKAGFTPLPSQKVAPPRVAEAPVSFECEVDQVIELGDQGGAGNLIISRVVMIHVQSRFLDQQDRLDTEKLDLVGRMGASWYCRASGSALFEIPKPLRNKGMGIDQLPLFIRESNILTANNLGRLGNVEKLPEEAEIKAAQNNPELAEKLKKFAADREAQAQVLHRFAKALLEEKEAERALATLLIPLS